MSWNHELMEHEKRNMDSLWEMNAQKKKIKGQEPAFCGAYGVQRVMGVKRMIEAVEQEWSWDDTCSKAKHATSKVEYHIHMTNESNKGRSSQKEGKNQTQQQHPHARESVWILATIIISAT